MNQDSRPTTGDACRSSYNVAPMNETRGQQPTFTLASRAITIDGQTVPSDRFEAVHEPTV